MNQRGDAADAVIFVFNWISDHLRYILSSGHVLIPTCRRVARKEVRAATRYPFYADQLTDTDGPDVRTHKH